MCTIITLNKKSYTEGAKQQIQSDAVGNSDGWCLVLVNEYGETVSNLRSMALEPILAALDHSEWERMFLHARFATGMSDICLNNTHGWGSSNYIYMHNGFIRHRGAENLAVDSKMIGKWLTYGVDLTISQLQKQPYANVFIIDTISTDYYVSRSVTNTLFTDGEGNYSTNSFDKLNTLVAKNTSDVHSMQVKVREEKTVEWSNYNDEWSESNYANWEELDIQLEVDNEISLLDVNYAGSKK